MVKSIYWITRPNDGVGNGAGYAFHNRKMYEHTSKFINCDDPNADVFLQINPADFYKPIPNKINAIFSMFEMHDIPESYKEPLANADYVLVPCKYCQDLFKPYTKRLPIIFNEGIESQDFPYYQRKEPNYAQGERFRVYWSGAPNPRKGYQYMLRLINNADDYPDMEFYIKTTMNDKNPLELMLSAREVLKSRNTLSNEEREALEIIANGKDVDRYHEFYSKLNEVKVYGKHKNVFFDTRRVPFDELRELYNKAHVFIFPSQGEGWGLMGTEALATGCPVIAPMHTGILEYFDAQIGYPLEFTTEEVKSSNYNITTGVYVPFYDDLVRQIWNVKNNYAEALVKGKRGSKRMHEKFRWEQQGAKLAKWLEKLDVPTSNTEHKTLSICIPTYNMGDQLKDLLQSIVDQQIEVGVCISDNASTDNTKEIVDSYSDKLNIKYHRFDENKGFDVNIDNVAKMADTDYVWLMGADDKLINGSLLRLIINLQKNNDIYLMNRLQCDHNFNVHGKSDWNSLEDGEYKLLDDWDMFIDSTNSLGGLFSYISNLCFKRSLWDSKVDDEWFSSGYIHIRKMFNIVYSGCTLNYTKEMYVFCRDDDRMLKENGAVKRKVLDFKWYRKLISGLDHEDKLRKVMTREHNFEYVKSIDNGELTEYIDYFYNKE